MAVIADLERRTGVGWTGVLLWVVLVVGGILAAAVLGDLPVDSGNYIPPRMLVPSGLYMGGLTALVYAVCNAPTYLRLVTRDAVDTGEAGRASGTVVLKGTVHVDESPLTTPFSGTAAVAYTTRVLTNAYDDAETARESEKNWGVRHVGEDAVRFRVDDGTGDVAVDPGDARFTLQDRERQLFTAGSGLPAVVREYLRDAGGDIDSDDHVRVEETTLEPGETVFVTGTVEGHAIKATLVAEGDHAERVRDRVVRTGGYGIVLTVAGAVGLLLVAGVV